MPTARFLFLLFLVIAAGAATVWVGWAAARAGKLDGQVLMAMLPQLAGCYSWRQVPPQDLTPERLEGVSRLRLATSGGWRGELWKPTLQDSLLVGLDRGPSPDQSRALPINTLQEVEERYLDLGKSLAFGAGTVAVAVPASFLAFAGLVFLFGW